MVALRCKKRFAEPILAGTKDQTIGARRKVPIKTGKTLHLFTGMGMKQCRKIGISRCVEAIEVVVMGPRAFDDHVDLFHSDGRDPRNYNCMELNAFPVRDGFKSWPDLCAFWAEEHRGVETFRGHIYRWEPLRP